MVCLTSINTEIDECDKLKEECGVFAAYNSSAASYDCFLGLQALQHRGQEAAGIVSYDTKNKKAFQHLAVGQVTRAFENVNFDMELSGESAIGHVRYSTSGGKDDPNIQPVYGIVGGQHVAIAHNGNLIDLDNVRSELIKQGEVFKTSMDTEVILLMLKQSKADTIFDKLKEVLVKLKGAFSIVMLCDDMVIGIRDRYGIRPLVFGHFKDGEKSSYYLSSETCGLDILNASHVRHIERGEMIVLKNNGYTVDNLLPKTESRFCLFEYIYFLRPDSVNDGHSIYNLRKKMGARLALESPVCGDVVISVPDSGVPAAMGFSEASNIPYECGIVRNHYIGRTFIKPGNEERTKTLRVKHNANKFVVSGKRVVVIDDSIVRGNTSLRIIKMLKEAGAREIHMRISSPEIKFSCFYGVDTPNRKELISSEKNVEEICNYLGLDSLAFLSLDGLYNVIIGENRNDLFPQFCDVCITGEYFI